VPVAPAQNPADAARPSDLQQVQAELVSELPVPDGKGGVHHTMPPLKTNSDYRAYIRSRTAAWKESKSREQLSSVLHRVFAGIYSLVIHPMPVWCQPSCYNSVRKKARSKSYCGFRFKLSFY